MHLGRLSALCLIASVFATTADAQPPVVCDPLQRAGYPLLLSPLACPSDTGAYVGYPVGGGAARYHKGEPSNPTDGTWGWDYAGTWFPRRVMLLWWHGRRFQGGVGSYRTDGPHLLHWLSPNNP